MALPVSLRPAAWRGYRQTMAMAAAGYTGENLLFLLDYALRLLRVAVLVSLWQTLLPTGTSVGGMTLAALMTYTLVAEALADLLDIETELTWTIHNGAVVSRYLQPIGMVGLYAAEWLGRVGVGLALFSLPLLLFAPILGVSPAPASLPATLAFPLSLALAIVIGLAFDFVMGALTVLGRGSIWMIKQVRNSALVLFSGALIPLALYPWGIGDIFAWLPFAAMASAPLRVYTGTGDVATLLVTQVGWAIAMWLIALWLWRVYRERLVGYGG